MDELNLWTNEENILIRIFIFENFKEAVDFVNKVAKLAEKLIHHPDIRIFSYKNVEIKITTHDEGNKITEKDIELASEIDKILL